MGSRILIGLAVYVVVTLPFLSYLRYGIFVCYVSTFQLNHQTAFSLVNQFEEFLKSTILHFHLRIPKNGDIEDAFKQKDLTYSLGVSAIVMASFPLLIALAAFLRDIIWLVRDGLWLELLIWLLFFSLYLWSVGRAIYFWVELKTYQAKL